ncbi:MAG TPA: LysR substrate-binding domain-containing protein [Candidatus Didemnitutus sp.]|nr:LysR substrate-binding domain-containing protein [Candidatus Didemnitutus sp.]
MELRHLRYFAAVAEALSFSRAAAHLHVTQPALSRQIRDLEEELGCRLLLRGRNARTELTPEGRLLLRGAREILAAAEKLAQQVHDEAARLRFGHYGALWLDYFSPTLRRFARRHKMRFDPVELTPGELAGALRRGAVDVALVGLVDAALRREFHTQVVAVYPVQLALPAGHPLAKRRKVRLGELRDARWVSWDEREFPGRKELLVAACRAAGFRPRIALATDSMASLFMHVATGDMVGHVLPMSRRMPHEGVVFVEVDPPGSFMSEIHAAWRRHEPADALIRDLVQEMAATRPR